MQAIEELPGQESPEIFGLHPNADLTFRTLQVQSGVQIIMDTQPKGAGGGGGLSREEIVDRICEDLLSKVSCLPFSPTPFSQVPGYNANVTLQCLVSLVSAGTNAIHGASCN